MGRLHYTITWNFLKLHKGGPSTERPRNKEIKDNARDIKDITLIVSIGPEKKEKEEL